MAKRIVAKTGEYTNQQGETKGEYTKLGVMLNNSNGEYMLLDPSVNLAGCLIKQNVLAGSKGGEERDMLMVSIFEDDNQGQQNNNQGQQNNNQNQGFNLNQQQQQQQREGNFNQNPHNYQDQGGGFQKR